MMHVITWWSIKHGVPFTFVKTNNSCYTAVCTFIKQQSNVGRNVCPWILHASILKSSGGYFNIKSYVGKYICSQPFLRSNHRKLTASFVCNVIMPIVRNKLNLTPSYIIDYIGVKYHKCLESFNNLLKGTRALPIQALIIRIFLLS